MRIGMISQWYDPEVGSAGIPGSIARALNRLGHEVDVVTGFPNYPTGKVYDGYRIRPHQREMQGSVTVHRVPVYPSHDARPVRRIANFASFAASAAVASQRCLRHTDVALVYSTPATVGAAGLALRRLRGIPFVLLIQDMWPDTVLATGMLPKSVDRIAWAITGAFCRSVYRRASRIAVIGPSMRDTLIDRGVPEGKVSVVFNWADEMLFKGNGHQPAAAGRSSRGLELMYAGSLGEVQGLEVAVRAMAMVPRCQNVTLRLVGSGVAEKGLRRLTAELALGDRVRFEGSRPVADMPALMASADVQLLCLRDLPLFRGVVPSKFQAILASGSPVVVSAAGDVAELARISGAGVAVQPEDPRALADAIGQVAGLSHEELQDWGRRGRDYYEAELGEAVGARRLVDLLERARRTRE
jgi:glycosyltransferase involved in cell wall biosynthesis